MNVKIESQVKTLAYHLWLSAGREYRRAADFWIMAEQMVCELATVSARLSGSAIEMGVAIERAAPAIATASLHRIQELAYFMWEASGAQCGHAIDHWIAAERHVMTMMVVSGEMASSADPAQSGETDCFSANAYLNEIRTGAYYMWEKASREHSGDDHLGFWLAAERQVLHKIEAAARTQVCAAAMHNPNIGSLQPGTIAPHAPAPDEPDAHEVSLAPEPGGTASGPAIHPSPFRIRRLEPAQDSHTYWL